MQDTTNVTSTHDMTSNVRCNEITRYGVTCCKCVYIICCFAKKHHLIMGYKVLNVLIRYRMIVACLFPYGIYRGPTYYSKLFYELAIVLNCNVESFNVTGKCNLLYFNLVELF